MEEKKGKRLKIEGNNGETVLPEALIQHIQSFMTGKEAAQTTVLNKSWCGAWLTRPTLDFDQTHFRIPDDDGLPKIKFTQFVKKSMQRYEDLNLKIDRFRLRTINYMKTVEVRANKLIVEAIKLGATDLDLELRSVALLLPREVLESETLLRLSVSGRRLIDGYNVKCSRLKTLALGRVRIKSDDLFRGIISRCISLEELSLSHCILCRYGHRDKMFGLSAMNLPHHPNLRCLSLESVEVDPLFFSDNFDSRFPCLNDLSVSICYGYKSIQIHSTSLETLSFVQLKVLKAEFDVPNLVTLRYSGKGIPSFSVQSSREWGFYLSLPRIRRIPSHSWLSKLKKAFTKMTQSKIFLHIESSSCMRKIDELVKDECIHRGVGKPVELEDVMIESYSMGVILVGLLAFCRPKFITQYWPIWTRGFDESLDWICKRLMKEFMTANRCIPDQNVFGKIGLKEVDVEVCEEILKDQWRPIPLLLKEPLDFSIAIKNKRRIRFQLRWG